MTVIQPAYFGKNKLKKKYVKRVEQHTELGSVRQRTYGTWEVIYPGTAEFRGCFIGCTLQPIKWFNLTDGFKDEHEAEAYASSIGVPNPQREGGRLHSKVEEKLNFGKLYTVLIELVFESLDPADAKYWPAKIMNATKVGTEVSDGFMYKLVQNNDVLAHGLEWAREEIGVSDECDHYFAELAFGHCDDYNPHKAAEILINAVS